MKKNIIYILITSILIGSICYYLYSINNNYDGGLVTNLTPFVYINMPLIAGISLWNSITGKTKITTEQKTWQKIASLIFCLIIGGCTAYFLVASKFYNLWAIILAILLLSLIPAYYWQYKKEKKTIKNPVLNWAVSTSALYLLLLGIICSYMHIVSPVTVDQAIAIVNEEYGEDAYKFVGHLNFNDTSDPLGVYWFSQQDTSSNVWIEVDLLTGELKQLYESVEVME